VDRPLRSELTRALELLQQGQLDATERLLETLIARAGPDFDAVHLLGIVAARSGRNERALELFAQAIELNAQVAAAHNHLGLALRGCTRLEEAAASFHRALTLQPDLALARLNLSAVMVDLGQFDAALREADVVLRAMPDSLAARANRAAALRGLARLGEASAAYADLTRAAADNPDFWLQYAGVLADLERPNEAVLAYARCLALEPGCAAAHSGCSSALLSSGQPAQALIHAERALASDPQLAAAYVNKSAALLQLKHLEPALASAERASQLAPGLFGAQLNRAGALLALHRYPAAREAYELALELCPEDTAALCGHAQACSEMGDLSAALNGYERALRLDPNRGDAVAGRLLARVPVIPDSAEQVRRCRDELGAELLAVDQWATTASAAQALAFTATAKPFYLAYQEQDNRDLLDLWGRASAVVMERWATNAGVQLETRRGRVDRHVGIVSANVSDNSVFRALLRGWLEEFAEQDLRVTLFDTGSGRDAVTAWASERAELVECAGQAVRDCVRLIQERGVNLLLYPEVGMDTMSWQLACLRLAPHQIAAWGHPQSTGLPTIDFYLSARGFEPAGAERHYCEQLVQLPNLGCCYEYTPPSPAQPLQSTAGESDWTLICPGTPFKYAPEHDRLLVDIARQLGRCRFVFFEARMAFLSPQLLRRLATAFERAGLDAERHLLLMPWLPPAEFAGLMRQADLFLDTPGFSGFNTAMQAIGAGLPVVAFEGRFMRGRFASAILQRLALDRCIARSPAEYVRRSVELVRDEAERRRIREHMHQHAATLWGDRAPTRALVRFLKSLPL
jgi:protein O-GlcNAc transferase